MQAHIVSLASTLFQLVFLGLVLGFYGWQFRNFLTRRAESRQNARNREVAALMEACRTRQRRNIAA